MKLLSARFSKSSSPHVLVCISKLISNIFCLCQLNSHLVRRLVSNVHLKMYWQLGILTKVVVLILWSRLSSNNCCTTVFRTSNLNVFFRCKGQFGRSDLYFICKLEPISDEDEPPVPQEGEIEAVSWLPLDEYRKMVHSKDSNIGHPMMSRVMDVVDSSSEIERMIVPSIVPGRKHSPLYHAPIGSSE